jgi:hypothetical protein
MKMALQLPDEKVNGFICHVEEGFGGRLGIFEDHKPTNCFKIDRKCRMPLRLSEFQRHVAFFKSQKFQ